MTDAKPSNLWNLPGPASVPDNWEEVSVKSSASAPQPKATTGPAVAAPPPFEDLLCAAAEKTAPPPSEAPPPFEALLRAADEQAAPPPFEALLRAADEKVKDGKQPVEAPPAPSLHEAGNHADDKSWTQDPAAPEAPPAHKEAESERASSWTAANDGAHDARGIRAGGHGPDRRAMDDDAFNAVGVPLDRPRSPGIQASRGFPEEVEPHPITPRAYFPEERDVAPAPKVTPPPGFTQPLYSRQDPAGRDLPADRQHNGTQRGRVEPAAFGQQEVPEYGWKERSEAPQRRFGGKEVPEREEDRAPPRNPRGCLQRDEVPESFLRSLRSEYHDVRRSGPEPEDEDEVSLCSPLNILSSLYFSVSGQ